MASSIELLPPTTSRAICDGSGLIGIWYGDDWDLTACHGCGACTHPMPEVTA